MSLWAKIRQQVRTISEKVSFVICSLSAHQYYKDGKYWTAIQAATLAYELALKLYGEKHHLVGVRLNMLGVLLEEVENFNEAEECFSRAAEIVRASRGESHRDYAVAIGHLASVYKAKGKYAQAELLYKQALEIQKAFYGVEHLDVSHALNSLALLYLDMNRFGDAEELFKQLMKMDERIYPRRYTREWAAARATYLHNLAALYTNMGDYSRAESCYTLCLQMRRAVYGRKHPTITQSLNNLAYFYLKKGDYEKAGQLANEALQINRKTYGEIHHAVATGHKIIASISEHNGKYQEAESRLLKALEIDRQINGENHEKVADDLNSLGLLYFYMAKYAEADESLRKSRQIIHAVWGETMHKSLYPSMNNQALLYRKLGRYEESEALYLEVLKLLSELVGEDHPDYARCLENLAEVYITTGKYAEAWELLRQALNTSARVYGDNNPLASSIFNKLGVLFQQSGRYSEAEVHYQQALSIVGATDGSVETVEIENNLAGLYMKAGRYIEAEARFQHTLRLRRALFGEEHPGIALTLNNLGNLYLAINDYTKALSHFQRASEILLTAYGENHPELATTLHNMSMLHYYLGQYDLAIQYCARALEIRASALGKMHSACGESLNCMGLIMQQLGDYKEAEENFNLAHEILSQSLGPEHPDTTIVLFNLAEIYSSQGRFDEAAPLFSAALEMITTALGNEHPQLSMILSTMALSYCTAGRADEALALMERAEAIADQTLGQVMSLSSERQRLGYLLELQVNLSAFLSLVLRFFPHSSEKKEEAFNLVLRRKALGAEALYAQRDAVLRGHYPELAEPLRRLIELQRQIAEKILAGPGAEGIDEHTVTLASLRANKEELEAELAHQIPDIKLIRQIYRANCRIVADALPEESALVEFVHFDDFSFESLPAPGESRIKSSGYLAFVVQAAAPNGLEMIYLGDAELINRAVAAFVQAITNEALDTYEPLAESESDAGTEKPVSSPLAEEAGKRRGESSRPPMFDCQVQTSGARSARELGGSLRKLVFDPLLAVIGTCRNLFISADGDLTRLPFNVLPLDEKRYVIDDFEISYLSTGRDTLRSFKREDSSSVRMFNKSLVAANPSFDLGLTPDTRGAEYPETLTMDEGGQVAEKAESVSRGLPRGKKLFEPLPDTQEEGRRVAEMLHVQPLLADQVLKQLIKNCQSPSILHIATHGFFLSDQKIGTAKPPGKREAFGVNNSHLLTQEIENPLLRSGLALAGANTWLLHRELPEEAGNGILTSLDVSGLDLIDTELVVLSACETGLGQVHRGEGVFGLRRAVELAGAKTLIMSLWKVSDQATQSLMIEFYRRVVDGQSRAKALRQAQLAMKNRHDAHPFFWGAFICQGDPRPLPLELLHQLSGDEHNQEKHQDSDY